MALEPSQVDVWYRITDTLNEGDVADAIAVLSPDERTRHGRFVFAHDRRDYAAAHALLRGSLSRHAVLAPSMWRFHGDGKPSLVAEHGGLSLSFNLSHTRGLVACAISGGSDVGIDVEAINRAITENLAERVFSETEMADLRGCAPGERSRRFFELWTLKEAYIKAKGQGLSHPLNTFTFGLTDDGSIVFVGQVSYAKGYGVYPTYVVRRRQRRDAS